jgi:hypothetical protein
MHCFCCPVCKRLLFSSDWSNDWGIHTLFFIYLGCLRLSPLGTQAYYTSPVWWIVMMMVLMNENWPKKCKYSEKIFLSSTLSAKNPTWPNQGSNSSHSGEKPERALIWPLELFLVQKHVKLHVKKSQATSICWHMKVKRGRLARWTKGTVVGNEISENCPKQYRSTMNCEATAEQTYSHIKLIQNDWSRRKQQVRGTVKQKDVNTVRSIQPSGGEEFRNNIEEMTWNHVVW